MATAKTAKPKAAPAAEAKSVRRTKRAKRASQLVDGVKRKVISKMHAFTNRMEKIKFQGPSMLLLKEHRLEEPRPTWPTSIKAHCLPAPGEQSKDTEPSWWMVFAYIALQEQ
jgi:hypothetical protein